MSQSSDAHLLSKKKVVEFIAEHKTRGDIEVLEKAMEHFGAVKDDMFLIANIEAWDDYNAYYEFMSFCDRYFGLKNFKFTAYEAVDKAKVISVQNGANAEDVASELDVELPEEEE